MNVRWRLAAACVLGLVAACARREVHTRNSTAFEVFIPPAAEGYELPRNEKIVLGEPLAQGNPAFPAALQGKGDLHKTACLEIEIDESGRVYASRPLYAMPDCPQAPDGVSGLLARAAQNAVAGWRFRPALLCEFPAGTDAASKGSACEGAAVHPLAIKLAFVFTFDQQQGVASTSVSSVR
jgi:hypothetical protein